VEYIVDFGWKSEPDTARLLIEAIDKQIFDDAMQKNPAMLLPLLARDVETLQQEIGFTELSHVYNSLAMGRPKEELH
jgi:bisphosphoglycerate-independent phosphoglycerate mutase (AlkP superfamily)